MKKKKISVKKIGAILKSVNNRFMKQSKPTIYDATIHDVFQKKTIG